MPLSDAERKRRSRAHGKGDHSFCDLSRCDGTPTVTDVTASQPAPPADSTPKGLARRGRQLWKDVTATGDLTPPERTLLEQACRIADRLDRLAAFVAGDSDRWATFSIDYDSGEVMVVIDKALSEERQQAVAFKQLLAELRQSRAGAGTGRQPIGKQPPAKEGAPNVPDGVGDLTARIAAKRGGATTG